jgi:hypothetical protein
MLFSIDERRFPMSVSLIVFSLDQILFILENRIVSSLHRDWKSATKIRDTLRQFDRNLVQTMHVETVHGTSVKLLTFSNDL